MSSLYMSQFRETNTRKVRVNHRQKSKWKRQRKRQRERHTQEAPKERERRREKVGSTHKSWELAEGEPGTDQLEGSPAGSQMPGQKGALTSSRCCCLPWGGWGMVERPCCLYGGPQSQLAFQPWTKQVGAGKPMVRERSLWFLEG